MRRLAKVLTLLAVYLVWICGTSVVAISCHANHVNRHSLCSHCCECHHEGCDKIHVEEPHRCNHDHSNKAVFYDTAKRNSINIEPVELCISAQLEENLSIEDIPSIRQPRYYERDIPIPSSPDISRRGMRAPPVVA
jgi:hypothetical protein